MTEIRQPEVTVDIESANIDQTIPVPQVIKPWAVKEFKWNDNGAWYDDEVWEDTP